jgi:hypothetical protein
MLIITYATHIDGYMSILVKQCEELNLNLVILGMNKKWEGFFQRTLDYYDYLNSLKDDKDICVFIDGFDTLVMENENTILDKYNSFNKPIVWGVDLSRNLLGKLFFGSEDILINGGSYMGRIRELKELFSILIKNYGKDKKLDDQIIINEFYLKNKDYFDKKIAFDINSIIFANANNKSFIYYILDHDTIDFINLLTFNKIFDNVDNLLDYHYDDLSGKIICNKTKISPSFISGPGCISFDYIVNKLGYNFKNNRCKDYWNNMVIYNKIKNNLIIISLFLLLIFLIIILKKK